MINQLLIRGTFQIIHCFLTISPSSLPKSRNSKRLPSSADALSLSKEYVQSIFAGDAKPLSTNENPRSKCTSNWHGRFCKCVSQLKFELNPTTMRIGCHVIDCLPDTSNEMRIHVDNWWHYDCPVPMLVPMPPYHDLFLNETNVLLFHVAYHIEHKIPLIDSISERKRPRERNTWV